MSLVLQQCGVCQTVQYPTRQVCVNCLSDQLSLQSVSGAGELLACSALHHSLDKQLNDTIQQQRTPWLLASVKLDCGPVVLGHLLDSGLAAGARVDVSVQTRSNGFNEFQIQRAEEH